MSTKIDVPPVSLGGGWTRQMAAAYSAGKADGKAGGALDVSRAAGFDACYWQGASHGRGACVCPTNLTGRRGTRCPNCGSYNKA